MHPKNNKEDARLRRLFQKLSNITSNKKKTGLVLFWNTGHVEAFFDILEFNQGIEFWYVAVGENKVAIRQAVATFTKSLDNSLSEKTNLFQAFLHCDRNIFVPVSFFNSPLFLLFVTINSKITFFQDSAVAPPSLTLRERGESISYLSSLIFFIDEATVFNPPDWMESLVVRYKSGSSSSWLRALLSSLPTENEIWVLGKDRISAHAYAALFELLNERQFLKCRTIFFPHPRCSDWKDEVKLYSKESNFFTVEWGYLLGLQRKPKVIISLGTSIANIFFGDVQIIRIEDKEGSRVKRGFSRDDLHFDRLITL